MAKEFQQKKPARNPDELLVKLKERKLTIAEDEEIEVKNAIRTFGYFRLSGFFGPLQNPKDVFREGASFDDILRLYHFDRKLRRLTSNALKIVEIELRARITDIMSASNESDWYMTDELFMTDKTKKAIVSNFICVEGQVVEQKVESDIKLYESLKRKILESIDRNSEIEYVKKFKNDYGDETVPSWMMMECISFGDLSRLFSLLLNCPEKKAISSHFGAITADFFASWLHGFVVLRNACAHHTRIWNKKLMKDLAFPKKPSAKFVSTTDEQNLRKYYGISACLLKTLSSTSEDNALKYKDRFYELVDEFGIDTQALGFPSELEEFDIWKREDIKTSSPSV